MAAPGVSFSELVDLEGIDTIVSRMGFENCKTLIRRRALTSWAGFSKTSVCKRSRDASSFDPVGL
jgi:hypothetical protein